MSLYRVSECDSGLCSRFRELLEMSLLTYSSCKVGSALETPGFYQLPVLLRSVRMAVTPGGSVRTGHFS